MDNRLRFTFDENLRDIPVDPEFLKSHTDSLKIILETITEPVEKVRLLGQLGVFLRVLGRLTEAEEHLLHALELIENHRLSTAYEVQQKIRLAHVYQWQKAFDQSNPLFDEILALCRNDHQAEPYLDFALQHAGKNLFDQKRYDEALQFFHKALSLRRAKDASGDLIESTQFAINRTNLKLAP